MMDVFRYSVYNGFSHMKMIREKDAWHIPFGWVQKSMPHIEMVCIAFSYTSRYSCDGVRVSRS